MKTKIVVLTSFLATSIALALVMLTSNAWAEETGPEAGKSARETRRDDRREARGDQGDDHDRDRAHLDLLLLRLRRRSTPKGCFHYNWPDSYPDPNRWMCPVHWMRPLGRLVVCRRRDLVKSL